MGRGGGILVQGTNGIAERPKSDSGRPMVRSSGQFLFTQQRVFGAFKLLEKGSLVIPCAKLDRRISSGQLGKINEVYSWRVRELLAFKVGPDALTTPIGRELVYVESGVKQTLSISEKLPHPTDPHAKLCDAVGILVLDVRTLVHDPSAHVSSIDEALFDTGRVRLLTRLQDLSSALGIERTMHMDARPSWEFESGTTGYFGSLMLSIRGMVGRGSASGTIFATPQWKEEAGLVLATPKGLVLADNTNVLTLEHRNQLPVISPVVSVGSHPVLADQSAGYGGSEFGLGGRSGGSTPADIHGGPNCMRGGR
jgi:hypothetical protein